MTDDPRRPSDSTHARPPSSSEPKLEPLRFEQLALDATITGPGRRTEDHYEPGAILKIKGERGVFTYRHASVSRAGHVSLHLVGENGSRAVRPEQVIPVRRKRIRQ